MYFVVLLMVTMNKIKYSTVFVTTSSQKYGLISYYLQYKPDHILKINKL